jgi:hypothetical protein
MTYHVGIRPPLPLVLWPRFLPGHYAHPSSRNAALFAALDEDLKHHLTACQANVAGFQGAKLQCSAPDDMMALNLCPICKGKLPSVDFGVVTGRWLAPCLFGFGRFTIVWSLCPVVVVVDFPVSIDVPAPALEVACSQGGCGMHSPAVL